MAVSLDSVARTALPAYEDHVGKTCEFVFGGDLCTLGAFYPPLGSARDTELLPTVHPGPAADYPSPVSGRLLGVAWSVTSAGASFRLWKNGGPYGAPLPQLVGGARRGWTPLTNYLVSAGDSLSLQYVGGANPPGPSILVFVVVGQ